MAAIEFHCDSCTWLGFTAPVVCPACGGRSFKKLSDEEYTEDDGVEDEPEEEIEEYWEEDGEELLH
jgi:uncharacterized Zn finger protein (UPF0148 family)